MARCADLFSAAEICGGDVAEFCGGDVAESCGGVAAEFCGGRAASLFSWTSLPSSLDEDVSTNSGVSLGFRSAFGFKAILGRPSLLGRLVFTDTRISGDLSLGIRWRFKR